MNTHLWHRWQTCIVHALAMIGIGLAGISAGGEDDVGWADTPPSLP